MSNQLSGWGSVFIVVAITSALKADTKTMHRAVQNELKIRGQLIHKRDLQAYAETMAKPFVWKTDKGLIYRGKDPFLGLIQMQMDLSKTGTSFSFSFSVVTSQPNMLVLKVTTHSTTEQLGKDNKKYRSVADIITRETWIKTTYGWKTKEVDEIQSRLMRNGVQILPRR